MAGKKRGNAEGTVVERADGRWMAAYTDGMGKRRYIYGRTRQEAAKRLAEAIRDRDRGVLVVGDKQTVADYLAAWLETMRPPRIRESTWIRYESFARLHIVPVIGRVKLAQLNRMHVQQVHSKASAAGLAASTIGPLHAILHHALKDAMRSDVIMRNVAEFATPPKPEKREMQIYDPTQVDTLLAAAEGRHPSYLYTLVALTVATGMRLGELLALRWSRVDLSCGVLHVKATRTRTRKGFADGRTKTPAGVRDITLIPEVVDELRAHKRRQAAERLRLGDAWMDEDRVFPSSMGGALNFSNPQRHWLALVARAGLPEIRFHDLRHGAASWLIAQGVPLTEVAQVLGHADIAVLSRVYAHALPGAQDRVAKAMASMYPARKSPTEQTARDA